MLSPRGEREYRKRMRSDYPVRLMPDAGGADVATKSGATFGAWRYPTSERRRIRTVIAVLISAGLHVTLLYGFRAAKPKPPRVAVDETPRIELHMPDVKDLEEPEKVPVASDEPAEAVTLAPMQPDLPQVVQASDFVQRIDLSSLIEKPDMSGVKVFAVPENISRGTIRQNIGTVFNISDLDRQPEALVQTPPLYPYALKREGATATVRVQFIVDSEGHVVNPVVVDSSHSGFNDAAMQGVSKWRFRAGMKGGRRVNTRMEVPILFKVTGEE
jgi:periplasmic protein TonB